MVLSVKDKRAIDDVYFNTENGGAYLSPGKVYQVLKAAGYSQLGLHKIRRYIQSLDSYSLQKPSRHRFRRARVEVSGPFEQYDADLADVSNLSSENDGIRFLLIVIDVFSRFLWVEPLRSKTGKEVLKAFDRIVKRGVIPKRLRSDGGSEFNNQWLKKWCKEHDVYYFTTKNVVKANYSERVIRTLKTILYRFFTKQRSYRYIDDLQDFVSSYNATPHRSLHNVAPKDVNDRNKADLFAYMYLRRPKQALKSSTKRSKTPYAFKIGSLVRISHIRKPFDRAYQQKWTSEIFKIRRRFLIQNIPQYQLEDFQNEKIDGNFYQAELQRVDKDQNTLWFIEQKLRKRKRQGQVEWLVKFDGWPSKYNQWIAQKDISEVQT
ncbi:uncharacterized protein [Argopecten irradians]|uniref:uncharacterized protein n=1 Tax=Argopecten irradians TaxID=31199 RepID=UPI00371A1DB2